MAKKNKSSLNQNIEKELIKDDETVKIISKQFETNDFDKLIKKDLSDLANDDAPQYPIVEIKPIVKVVEKPKVVIKPKRTIDSLNREEYRFYLRTGIIPK